MAPDGVALLRDDRESFDALRDAVAEILSLPAGMIEKDYWATEVLRSATSPIAGAGALVFKGGTSLSKAFGIIERFSEDIDLLVVTDLEGNQRKKLLRSLAVRATGAIGASHEREKEGHGYLNARYAHQARVAIDFLTPGVLLEMGCRGGPLPNQQRSIESLVATYAETVTPGSRADYVDLDAFEVTVLAPQRTLAEKLAFLHHRASIGDLQALQQGARHAYDAYRLLTHEETIAALRSDGIAELMIDIDEKSRLAGWPFTPRPFDGFAASPAFGEDPDIVGAIVAGYVDAAPLIWGEQPSFDQIIACIHEHAELL
ncbi:MAG: nucleotidyl transferase AbiEii/AbiGii toxin family protein [Acidimicrobiales bacterium]